MSFELNSGKAFKHAIDTQKNAIDVYAQYWKKETSPGSGVFTWVPISVADSLPVSLSGSKKKLVKGSYGKTLNLLGNGTEDITITPPAGELWRVKLLTCTLNAPTGSTYGTTKVALRPFSGSSDNYSAVQLSAVYNKNISLIMGVLETDTAIKPALMADFQRALYNVVATNNNPLKVNIYNATDAAQTNVLLLELGFEVEAVLW